VLRSIITRSGHREGDLVKMSIMVTMTRGQRAQHDRPHRGTAEQSGRGMCERLKGPIPRHLFKTHPGRDYGKQYSHETIAAMRKGRDR
jgi:GTP-binding protein LepA